MDEIDNKTTEAFLSRVIELEERNDYQETKRKEQIKKILNEFCEQGEQ